MHWPNTKSQLSRRLLGTKDSNLASPGRLVSREGHPTRVIGLVTALPLVQAEVEACPPVTLGERRRNRWTAAVAVRMMSSTSLAMIPPTANFAKNM
jgi:hypothetical protein